MRIVSWTKRFGDPIPDDYELIPTSNGNYNLYATSNNKQILGVVKNVSEAEIAIKNLDRPIICLSREWVSDFTTAPRVRNLAGNLTRDVSSEISETFDIIVDNRISRIFQDFPRTI